MIMSNLIAADKNPKHKTHYPLLEYPDSSYMDQQPIINLDKLTAMDLAAIFTKYSGGFIECSIYTL
jgi:hypothetical protein